MKDFAFTVVPFSRGLGMYKRNRNNKKKLVLTDCSLGPLKGYLENSADPDQLPQNTASDQGLHCLQIFFSTNI